MLEAIATTPLVDELLENMIGIEADTATEPHVEILERDREAMRALKYRQTVGIGERRQTKPDPGQIGVEIERCGYCLHAPVRRPVPVVTILTGSPSFIPVEIVEIS